ncbi:uncharacterized protein LOC117757594 isoform X2 [Hippoglossus hippoglossus]|uniref:uncharacterized protein LOC117757594 isoform X2 n=1 Tax=Hippoglossus hippoglossus TaxID=8267 RepID=UPI00148CEE1B|nr:uncharacterized protein LOC117757594 isoform X2 [Hippoglossus hippoglossus]
MNWVGGSRSRLVMKSDTKKQREFFERRKMQKKLIKSGKALPSSPGDTAAGSGSMDLVTLFIVNQIAAKKENKDLPKVAVLGSGRIGSRKHNNPLVLPMSPCSPSQLSLVESQSQCSGQGTRQKSHAIPQGFNCRQLSPVLESAFSDNSASDYRQTVADPLSPFSSTSTASSGQGMFPLKLNLRPRGQTQTQPPPPWDTSGLEQIKFQPFSHPRGMTDNMPWSCGSNPPLYQLETPTVEQVLFGSPEPDVTEVRGRARHEVSFSLNNQPEDKEPMMDFILNQSECEQQFEEDLFRGFSNEDNEKEAFHIGSLKSKIYLKNETPVKSSAPQTVPESQCMGMELSNCGVKNLSCPGHSGSMNDCGYLPSFSSPGCYLSSDSNDGEDYCPPCLQPSASSYVERACCVDTSNQGSQVKPKQSHSQPRPLTPRIKPKTNIRVDEKVQPLNPEVCKCQKPSSGTRDAGTQTVAIPAAEMCDASTQCIFTADGASRHPVFSVHLPPVGLSMQHAATGRQTDTAAQPNTHSASTGNGGKNTPWSKKKPKADSPPGDNGKIFMKLPIDCFPDAANATDARGEESEEGSDERERHETDPAMMTDLSESAREEVTSATEEEAGAPQEIADILVLLRERKT